MSSSTMAMVPTGDTDGPSEPLRVAIITENFLPKIDGSTVTLTHLLQHLQATGVQAMLFGPQSGMSEYAGARLFGTMGVPLALYPGLKINFISPSFLRALRSFAPHIIHIVDPIWLGTQSLFALQILFPQTPIVTSHHTNLPSYARLFGMPYWSARTWGVTAWLHGFAKATLVPSRSTAGLLSGRGFRNLRVVRRGVDTDVFSPTFRSRSLRRTWLGPALAPEDSEEGDDDGTGTVLLSVSRLSPEKNLFLLIDAYALLPPDLRARTRLVFVGDGPYREKLRERCAGRGVRWGVRRPGFGAVKEDSEEGDEQPEVIFTGQLTGRALSEAFASGDVICAPSLTETFGQVTLQGMASGLPVAGLYAEGTADLVRHLRTGLLLDVRAASTTPSASASAADDEWTPLSPLSVEPLSWETPLREGEAQEGFRGEVACWEDDGALVDDCAAGPLPQSLPLAPPPTRSTSAPTPAASAAPGVPIARTALPVPPSPTTPNSRERETPRSRLTHRFSRTLATLIADPALRRQMGETAATEARENGYEWEACAGRMVDAYWEALGVEPPSKNDSGKGKGKGKSKEVNADGALTPMPSPALTASDSGYESDSDMGIAPGTGSGSGVLRRRRPHPFALPDASVSVSTSSTAAAAAALAELPLPAAALPLVLARKTPSVPILPIAGGTAPTSAFQTAVDTAVVLHALVAATLAHASYMVPALADLWPSGSRS